MDIVRGWIQVDLTKSEASREPFLGDYVMKDRGRSSHRKFDRSRSRPDPFTGEIEQDHGLATETVLEPSDEQRTMVSGSGPMDAAS
jgi:hypothetical protein